jgi:hypothetical protein
MTTRSLRQGLYGKRDMFVKTGLAHIGELQISSFDVVYVCPSHSELGTLIFRRRHAPPRRALFIDLPANPRSGTIERIRDVLDPLRHSDDWLA